MFFVEIYHLFLCNAYSTYIILCIAHLVGDLIGKGYKLDCPFAQPLPCLGKAENAVAALDEAHAELRFKRGHRPAHGGVADKQPVRGRSKAFAPRDLEEGS